jgi:hypothetical protein
MNGIQVDQVPPRDRSMFFWLFGDYNHRAAERAIHL